MRALIIFGHPNIDSFNGNILRIAEDTLKRKGVEYIIKNLYDNNFNPILTMNDYIKIEKGTRDEDIALEQIDVEWADTIILIYPIWWSGPPAIVKGWFDRVLTKGFAFLEREDGTQEGQLINKKLLIFSTSARSEEELTKENLITYIKGILSNGIFKVCGITDVNHQILYEVPDTSDEARNQMLSQVEAIVNQLQ